MAAIHTGPFQSALVKAGLSNEADHLHVVSISLFVAVLCLCIVLGHLLEENRWANESITALIIGCCTGFIVLFVSGGTSSHILQFNEELFFIYLLPPIIFNAGFQVKKKQFFHNFGPIMLFGAVGVFISFGIISAGCWFLFPKLDVRGLKIRDYLALGTIFSSTDTVCTLQVLHQDETPLLYSLVFGEGVVNDATSVVLFRAVQKYDGAKVEGLTILSIIAGFLYLFFTSTALGIGAGLLTAYVIKKLYFGRHSTDREIGLMTLMAYFSYMLAELFYLSGILTVFFCGIVMSHYTWHNVTENSRITSKHAFATLSFVAETLIFLYVGMDALDMEKWKMTKMSPKTSIGIFSSIILLILLGRAAFVFPISTSLNYMQSRSQNKRITLQHQVVIWWAGLMRGAVSIALAFNQCVHLGVACFSGVCAGPDAHTHTHMRVHVHARARARVCVCLCVHYLYISHGFILQFTVSGVTQNPEQATMITSTIIVVLFSTMVFGILTKPLIGWILPHHMRQCDTSDPSSPTAFEEEFRLPLLTQTEPSEVNVLLRRSSFSMLLQRPTYTIHYFWRKFDDAYMRPVFGGRGFTPSVAEPLKEGDCSEYNSH